MKKRRPRTWSQFRSPTNSPRTVHTRISESFPAKTKSFHELKLRRLQRTSSGKLQKGNGGHGDELYLNRNAFASLESLFDVKKPLKLPELHSFPPGYALPVGDSKNIVVPPPPQHRLHTEIELSEKSHVKVKEDGLFELERKKTDPDEEIQKLSGTDIIEIKEVITNTQEDSATDMAASDEEEMIVEQETTFEEVVEVQETTFEEEVEVQETVEIFPGDASGKSQSGSQVVSSWSKGEVAATSQGQSVHSGYAEGISIQEGANADSVMSANPLTDTALQQEMKEADERCSLIGKEIDQLKSDLEELSQKKDLTEEDTMVIKEKQDNLMSKLAEFEDITRKLQRLIGLSDPSSCTFAKMFGILPYTEEGPEVAIEEVDAHFGKEMGDANMARPCFTPGRFDLPKAEYPEDKLPRVIVCGYTEENIPKIVVADSERKGKKRCLENLTGKLNESLTMQEKLANENAQLEGGKYKLEEALLEKDSAVESLQRKVCGLQAEMRIVAKENTELTRQLACLNQRVVSPSPNCWCTCPGSTSTSAPPSPRALRPYSYTSSVQQEEDYCRCKCCNQSQFTDTFSSKPNTVGVTPDGCKSPCIGSPRLAGGASRTDCYISSESSARTKDCNMCCRSPVVKQQCPPPPQRGTCPADMENKLNVYGNNTKQLEQQLGSMENEVRNMQMELANVQRERQQLEQQRKLLKCTGPCAPCGCSTPSPSNLQPGGYGPPPTGPSSMLSSPMSPTVQPMSMPKMMPASGSTTCTGPCINAPMGTSTCPQQQLRDLREQYARLQDDYKNKLLEVSCLRSDTEKLKHEARDAKEEKEKMEIKLVDVQERLKLLEIEKDKHEGYKEQIIEQEQALQVAKQRFREAQDELEELRSLIQDQATQMEDYRNKYLQAQQQVEEQRRQLDLMEMDNARMNENVTLEIGRVKNQFQEKLAELAPLPDILKQTQVKLQEAQQLRMVAERNCEDLSRDLLGCKDKIQALQNQLDALRKEYQALQDETGQGTGRFEEMERKNAELRHENERMKNTLARFEEHEAQLQKRIDEKMHEITQLNATLDQVREDSARQVARTKERCETVRRSMQGQIADMERQLAQCRATARAAQKDRDEIRQKMQGQINNLNEAFEQAQGRIRSLQGHVNYLKTSYSNIFKGQGEAVPGAIPGEAAGQGYDTCDCNY